LHPVDENHILGFGYDMVENQWGGQQTAGIKLTLFDVTNFSKPKEVSTQVIGKSGTFSELLYNHKALMFSLNKGLMAFPVTRTADNYKTDFVGAYVYNISTDSLKLKTTITHMNIADGYDYGYEIKTIKAAIEVNESQKFRLIKKAQKRFGRLRGLKIAVLGVTFKPGTDDLREAPSISNIRMLLDEGSHVCVYDPVGKENFKKLFKHDVKYVNSPEETLIDAELAFIFTEWNEIKDLPLQRYKELMKNPVIFDGRNCYSLDEAEEAGVEYYSIGRRSVVKNRDKLSMIETAASVITSQSSINVSKTSSNN
jgi:uncharacterized protein YqgV (UPF0045/DUF77 family)